jgi:hypothetical protein
MSDDAPPPSPEGEPEIPNAAPGKKLTPEARRALEEANARRAAAPPVDMPTEHGGPSGLEPTRYGDWERKGIASDF